MEKDTLYVGLDVHAETIAVAVAEEGRDGPVRSLGVIPNDEHSVRQLFRRKLGPAARLRVCYEAGPCGYVLYWQLVELGVRCEVVAPTLIPVRSGDRVKTDRKDACKLARCYRAGDLTPVWVPDRQHEALRDLVRAREATRVDQRRAQHRLGKFLLRHGRRRPKSSGCAWGSKHLKWVEAQRFDDFALQAVMTEALAELDHQGQRLKRLEQALDHAVERMPAATRAVIDGLQALRGVAKLTAVTVVAEVGRLSRFEKAPELMSYSGLVSREHSSGGPGHARRAGITKTGNAHLRRVLVESAHAYRHQPRVAGRLKKRHRDLGLSDTLKKVAWQAQHRLHLKYCRMVAKDKHRGKVITAVSRELLGFMWALGVAVEKQQPAHVAPSVRRYQLRRAS